jgi:pyruvoyl-dependent arginine decarboxylase (PvlArgDC)
MERRFCYSACIGTAISENSFDACGLVAEQQRKEGVA